MNPVHLFLRRAFIALACVFATLVHAADKAAFDIPAGEVKPSLQQFAQQAGREIVFPSSRVMNGIRTNAIRGELSPEDALHQLLEGTGLIAARDAKTGAYAVRKETPVELKNVESRRESDSAADIARLGEKKVILETFEVFGKKTLNMDIRRSENDPQPYVVFDRQELLRSGASNLPEFLRNNLPSNVSVQSVNLTSPSTSPGNAVNLRGLGGEETIILVDGRRMGTRYSPGAGPVQPNLNGIPLGAIERVEILPSTASGIYGAGATGGVINVILKRDYAGLEIGISYGNTFDSKLSERRFEFSGGLSVEGGRTIATFAATLSDGGELTMEERALLRERAIAQVIRNDRAGFFAASTPLDGATTNIRSTSGANLTLKPSFGGTPLNSPVTSIPKGYAGPASDNAAGLVANAGSYNLALNNISGLDVLYFTPREAHYTATLQREMTPKLSPFAEATWSESDALVETFPLSSRVFSLAAADIANPFNQAIRITTPLSGIQTLPNYGSQYSARTAVGGIVELPAQWKLAAEVTYDLNSYRSGSPSASFSDTSAAGAVSSGQIDVFRDTNLYPVNFGQFPLTTAPGANTRLKSESLAASVRASGAIELFPFFRDTVLSTATEYRSDHFGENIFQATSAVAVFRPARSQNIVGVYSELRTNVVRPEDRKPWVHSLKIMLAGRYDEYRVNATTLTALADSGGNPITPISGSRTRSASANPTVALAYSPNPSLMIRASFGTGFLPPSVDQLIPTTIPSAPSSIGGGSLRDPTRGFEPIGTVRQLTGGNPALRPEENSSWSFGAVWHEAAANLRLSVDWTRLGKHDAIATPIIASQSDLESYLMFAAERFTRDASDGVFPAGRIVAVDRSLINLAELDFEAIDFGADWSVTTKIAKIAFRAKATRNLHLQTRAFAAGEKTEAVSTTSAPTWRGFATISLEKGGAYIGWTSRYYPTTFLSANHQLSIPHGSATQPAYWTQDVALSFQFRGHKSRMTDGLQIAATVSNLLDVDPPTVTRSSSSFVPLSLYAPYADPRGARYTISVRKRY